MSATQTKDERINLRLKHHAKLMLERAASFEGQTVSKFILNSALNNAEKQVKNMKLWLLIPMTPRPFSMRLLHLYSSIAN